MPEQPNMLAEPSKAAHTHFAQQTLGITHFGMLQDNLLTWNRLIVWLQSIQSGALQVWARVLECTGVQYMMLLAWKSLKSLMEHPYAALLVHMYS